MVGFAEQGARVVEEMSVAAVDLCSQEVARGDDKRACTRRTEKIGILKVVEGGEAMSSVRRRLDQRCRSRLHADRQSPVRPFCPREQRSGSSNDAGAASDHSQRAATMTPLMASVGTATKRRRSSSMSRGRVAVFVRGR